MKYFKHKTKEHNVRSMSKGTPGNDFTEIPIEEFNQLNETIDQLPKLKLKTFKEKVEEILTEKGLI